MNALFALVLESKREFGILKYLGATKKTIMNIVFIDAGLLGFIGNLTGITVGFMLSFLLIYVINKKSFGWTIQFYVPFDFILQSFVLIMVTALLSGIIPAMIASKVQAPEALRAE